MDTTRMRNRLVSMPSTLSQKFNAGPRPAAAKARLSKFENLKISLNWQTNLPFLVTGVKLVKVISFGDHSTWTSSRRHTNLDQDGTRHGHSHTSKCTQPHYYTHADSINCVDQPPRSKSISRDLTVVALTSGNNPQFCSKYKFKSPESLNNYANLMSSHRGPSKKKPGANVDFTPVIPKFLQGMIKPNPKPRGEDDSDGDDSKPTVVDVPKGKERPDLEDEAPTIVADDEILALLAKQEHKLVDGKFERVVTAQDDSQARKDDSAVEFGKKARPKKAGLDSTQKSSNTAATTSNDKDSKKRPAETNAETLNPTKRVEKKKMLSFDDEEDL